MKLFVSSTTATVESPVKRHYPDAVCITQDNYHNDELIGFTSLEEFEDKDQLLNLIKTVDELVYIREPGPIDPHAPTDSAIGYVEYFLLISEREFEGRELIEMPKDNFLELVDLRKTNAKQLWAVGCSITFGESINESDRYIEHLSKKVNLPYSLLAKTGSSIEWQADQILRSDIRKDDIIIWGLTSRNRFPLGIKNHHGHYPTHVNIGSYDSHTYIKNIIPKRFLLEDDQHVYNNVIHIAQVLNYAEKIGAKVILIGLLSSPSDVLYYEQFENFYHYHGEFVDFGDDGEHPGPEQHKKYAKFIIGKMKQNGLVT